MITINITEQQIIDFIKSIVVPKSIYDDVDALKNQMQEVLDTIDSINTDFVPEKAENLNDKDLNQCVGRVIFGYGNNCSNKPTTSNGYLINIPHDSKPTLYNKQIWFSRSSDEIYVRNLENGSWGAWKVILYDSGWIDLPLKTGIQKYSDAQAPQYRRVGNAVYLRGAVKGIKAVKTIIGTLPTAYRPTKVVSFTQNMSMSGGLANIARWQIQTDGDIEMQYNDYPWEESDGTEWYAIDANFLNN